MADKLLKRSWFRHRLSTPVIVMFAAGVLVWVNVQRYPTYSNMRFQCRGWPWEILSEFQQYCFELRRSGYTESWLIDGYQDIGGIAVNVKGLLGDIAVGLAILAMVALVCEWLNRRNQAKAFLDKDWETTSL